MNLYLTFYRLCASLGTPVVHLWLKRRLKNGKEDATRFQERLGVSPLARPQGKLCWIHAASVGESVSVLPLLRLLQTQHPTLHFMMTTGTVSSAKLMEQRLPQGIIHQYIPVDTPQAVRRFLQHWKPDVFLSVESELWPNLLPAARKSGCTMAIINGRMSERSFALWQKRGGMAKAMLGCFDECLAQSELDKERFEQLGAPHVRYLGNLKYEAPELPADSEELAKLQQAIGGRPVWVAASTHAGEEEQLAKAHALIQQHFPDALLLLIPRHAARGADLQAMLGENVALRSRHEPITAQTSIYLADTMGELGLFYRLAPVVFMGGSLIEHGGQNPLEPARLDCAIITGQHIFNFTAIYAELEQQKAVAIINSPETLAESIINWFNHPQQAADYAAQAKKLVQQHSGVTQRFADALQPLLEKS